MRNAGPAAGSGRAVARELGGMTAPVVVKLGGRALEAPDAARELAAEVARARAPLVLVHGGGAEVSAWCERLGLPPRFVEGLRVTDAATLEVATAVLAGLANKRLVVLLRAADVDAVGLSALDGGLVQARLHPDAARLGEVGRVQAVDPALVETLLAQGRLPVLASIGALGGRLLNLNADDLAAAVAGALGARALVLLSDAPGVKITGAPVPRVLAGDLEAMLAHREVQGGMRPKLSAAGAALAAGVPRVHIAAWSGPGTLDRLLAGTDGAPGTTITVGTPVEAAHG